MIPANRVPTHPGVILSHEFLEPLGVSQVAFAAHLGVPVQRINELVRGKRGVTPETAWLLALALHTTPEFSRRRMTSLGAAPLNRCSGSLRSSETLMSGIRRWTEALSFRRAPRGFGMASR